MEAEYAVEVQTANALMGYESGRMHNFLRCYYNFCIIIVQREYFFTFYLMYRCNFVKNNKYYQLLVELVDLQNVKKTILPSYNVQQYMEKVF